MADPGMPVRNGETLGDYYEWSYQLFIDACENISQRHAMREFYNGKGEPMPESYETCPQDAR